ncbi:hypothetical protein MTO96_016192 [Rhipicephalus appendiculatus]
MLEGAAEASSLGQRIIIANASDRSRSCLTAADLNDKQGCWQRRPCTVVSVARQSSVGLPENKHPENGPHFLSGVLAKGGCLTCALLEACWPPMNGTALSFAP